jgi:3-dehydroquinate synthase
LSKQGVVFADAHIAHTHGEQIRRALGFELIPVPSGEPNKTRETKQILEDELLKKRYGKQTLIIAVGGGMTTDLVGFLASTYMRGVPLVLIPTTLLGMVDAAIGGKTGVDTPFGKNLIGSFYLPKAVFIETEFLKTLSEKEIKNGMSEVLKYGLIADEAIWNGGDLESLIRASISCKMGIIEQDFDEKGLRRILNFGHTVGHALELLSQFQISHGEAVALGCMAESYLSHIVGHLAKEPLEQILKRYRNLGYTLRKVNSKAFIDAMSMDKKGVGGEPRFVMIDRIGHALPFNGQYCTDVSSKDLQAMIEWMAHG